MKNLFWYNQLKKDFLFDISYKISFYGQFVGIFLTTLIFYFISDLFSSNNTEYLGSYDNNYFIFAISGIALLDLLSVVLRSISISIRNAQAFGYIDSVINSGFNIVYLILCFMLYPMIKGLFRFFIYLSFAIAFSNVEVNIPTIIVLIFIIILTMLPFIGIALICGAFVLCFKQNDPVFFLTNSIVTIFSGIVYPIEILPSFMQALSNVIPITLGLDLIRKLVITNVLYLPDSYNYELSILIFFLIFISAVFLIKKSIKYIKKRGISGKY